MRATDALGGFAFSQEESANGIGLTLTHLGYRTLTVSLKSSDTVLDLRMELQPIALPDLTVSKAAAACPNRDADRARSLWQAARERYTTTTSERGISMRMLTASEDLVPASQVGAIPEERLRPSALQRAGATKTPAPGRYVDVNVRIRTDGYGHRAGTGSKNWNFVPLEGHHAHHLAYDVFGERRTLSVVDDVESEVVIAFCPVRKDQVEIEGLLVIGRNSSFISAQRRFRTPDRRDDAGGEVVFAPWSDRPGERPHLLAARGMYWRRHPKWTDRYHVRTTVFTDWVVSATDSMPDFPRGARSREYS
jgi:hypothetical protein